MAYQPGVPTGTVALNEDYLNLQENFTQLNDQWLVDHVPLTTTSGTPPNGYHLNIHMVPFSDTTDNPPNNYPASAPAATGGYLQLWSSQSNDGYNPDEMLFILTGGGRLTQLTRNFQPLPFTNNYPPAGGGPNVGVNFSAGATFIPGALTFQYGSFTPGNISPSTGTVKFPLKFINAPSVIVTITPICKAGGANINNTFSVITGTVTVNQFQWSCQTSTSQYTGFTWTAVGS